MKVLRRIGLAEERARAFLNTPEPMLEPANGTVPREINFARYASAFSGVLRAIGLRHPQMAVEGAIELEADSYERNCRVRTSDTLEQMQIQAYMLLYHGLKLMDDRRAAVEIIELSSRVIELVNRLYLEVIREFLTDIGEVLSNFKNGLEVFEKYDAYSDIFSRLRRILKKIGEKSAKKEEEVQAAIKVLDRIFYVHERICSIAIFNSKVPIRSRIIITDKMQKEWERVRMLRPDSVTQEDLTDAAHSMGIGVRVERIGALLNSNERYRDDYEIEFDGLRFRVETGPFVLKPILCNPASIQMALYPLDSGIAKLLGYFRDQRFEHADGAAAIAGLNVSGGNLVLEEVQTDALDLIRNAVGTDAEGLRRIRALEDYLAKPLSRLTEMIFSAVLEFRRRKELGNVYGFTPFSITERYGGEANPKKVVDIYYRGMKSVGGVLVFDEEAEFGKEGRHYWKLPA